MVDCYMSISHNYVVVITLIVMLNVMLIKRSQEKNSFLTSYFYEFQKSAKLIHDERSQNGSDL